MGQLTCPQCGHSLEQDGAILSTCPRCHAEVASGENELDYPPAPMPPHPSPVPWGTPPRGEGGMGGKLDGAALMRRVLGEQSPGEDIYAALERLVPSEHPQNAAKILQAIQHHLKLQQERFGNEPQRAAEFLAKSSAFLSFDSKGNPFLEAFFFEAKGFPNLSEPARSQFLEQMQKAIREGKPIAAEIVGPSEVKIQGLEELPQETRLEVLMQIKKAIEENKPFPQEIITQRVVKIQGSSCLTIVLFLLVMGALILAYLLSRH